MARTKLTARKQAQQKKMAKATNTSRKPAQLRVNSQRTLSKITKRTDSIFIVDDASKLPTDKADDNDQIEMELLAVGKAFVEQCFGGEKGVDEQPLPKIPIKREAMVIVATNGGLLTPWEPALRNKFYGGGYPWQFRELNY
jgi:hypothetical protein